MDEDIALQPLEDEPLPAEQARPQVLLKCDAEADAAGCRQERTLLREQFTAHIAKTDREDLARIGRAERYPAPRRAAIDEDGHE